MKGEKVDSWNLEAKMPLIMAIFFLAVVVEPQLLLTRLGYENTKV